MQFTYDLNQNGCLILKADSQDREQLAELPDRSTDSEYEAVEKLIANSELEWIDAEETGDLTSAPMLGLRDEQGQVISRWAFMDYQVRSFIDDLIEKGKAVFIS
jgi:hypothetical protein